ncbi:hypothetical protein PPHE_b0474 [Pseudoalteromonas phenolica O-BC30]|nr:hypothetical protein [Pseudoalteromonas phenolica O-BC30]
MGFKIRQNRIFKTLLINSELRFYFVRNIEIDSGQVKHQKVLV